MTTYNLVKILFFRNYLQDLRLTYVGKPFSVKEKTFIKTTLLNFFQNRFRFKNKIHKMIPTVNT